jgi:hypothetical protein
LIRPNQRAHPPPLPLLPLRADPNRSPPSPIAAYAVSKTALLGLVKGLAAEMGPDGVTVNGVVGDGGGRPGRRGLGRGALHPSDAQEDADL